MKSIKPFIQRFFLRSIRRKLVFSFLFLIILPISLSSMFSFIFLQDVVKDKLNIGNEMAISQATMNIELVFKNMVAASNSLMMDGEIRDIIKQSAPIEFDEIYHNNTLLKSKFFAVQTSVLDHYPNHFISLLSGQGISYSTISAYENEKFQGSILALLDREGVPRKTNYVKLGEYTHELDYFSHGKVRYIILVRAYMDVIDGIKTGDVVIGVPESVISAILNGMAVREGIKAHIVNRQGEIISSTAKEQIGEGLPYARIIKGNLPKDTVESIDMAEFGVMANVSHMERLGWTVVSEIPNKLLFSEIAAVRKWLFLINLGFIVAFFSLAYWIANSVSKPVSRLKRAASEFATGRLDSRVEVVGVDELALLSLKFNKMAEEIGNLVQKVNEDEKAKRELEIQMLYSQINPHFLFNTLNSIRWMADASKVYNVSKFITSLAQLMKSSIIQKNEIIPLAEELENIRHYITIQKMRFSALFTEEYKIEEDTLNLGIPKLILQPIVENSILHGFASITYKGIIRLRAYRDESNLTIIISDNGVGCTEEQLKSLLAAKGMERGRFSGIGITNVNERLKLHYGPDYALRMENTSGGGTTSILKIPIHELNHEMRRIDHV
ncbi:sensor histidine kinase [Paenibacillus sp. GXUN7292]|uniref:sensor histidine kinase n=1 Tax=Paenibacillus sp. GXUN7292 TaxID=3422499 RepID=UPI003D7C4598